MILSDLVDFIHPKQIKIDKESAVEGGGSEKSKMAANLSVVSGVREIYCTEWGGAKEVNRFIVAVEDLLFSPMHYYLF